MQLNTMHALVFQVTAALASEESDGLVSYRTASLVLDAVVTAMMFGHMPPIRPSVLATVR
jgi:hypothetical protein